MRKIQFQGPYNFDQVLERLSFDPLNIVDVKDRFVKVPLIVDRKPFVIKVQATGTTDDPEFVITGMEDSEEIFARIAHLFQWDIPLTQIHNHFQQTDLKPIFDQHRGTPLILDFDPYFCLLKCIIHQQLNMSFARTLTERFVKTYGFEVDGVYFYPKPEVVAQLKVEDLRELQFSGRKAEYVVGIADAIVSGQLNLDEMNEKTDDAIMQELGKIRGIGPWTVQNYLMFGLGRPNLFPMADIGIQNALKKLYELDRKPSFEEMEHYKKGWEPYLSYASLYLWRSIEQK